MKNLKITTSQIAKICNVSQGTVDRALNNRSGINAATKEKIINVALKYGYREEIKIPNISVKGLIGIVVFNLNNEYFSQLIEQLEYSLKQEGIGTVVMLSHYDASYEAECIRNLYNMGVLGIVCCPVNRGAEFENYLNLFNVPIVIVGNRLANFPYVGIDDFEAMKEMTNCVLSKNPQNIIYFSPALNYSDAYAQHKRYEGFLNAVGNNKYQVVTDIEDIKTHYEENTIIICSNDYYALKVYFKKCNAKIVGFDNISTLDKYNINIDSVGYSFSDIASNVIKILKTDSKDDTLIPYKIICR